MLSEYEWRTTWEQVELIDLEGDGEHELLLFDSSQDDFRIHNLTRSGEVGRRIYESDWAGAWTHIEAANIDQEPGDELFIYSATGRVRIHDLTSNGVSSISFEDEWRTSWDELELVDVDGDGEHELLAFDSSQNDFWIHNLTRSGQVGARIHEDSWSGNWTHIEAANTDQEPGHELILYSDTGRFRIQEPESAAPELVGVIEVGDRLTRGESLRSENGDCRLEFQGDQNLSIYQADGTVAWHASSTQSNATLLTMQADGNLVLNNATGNVWNTHTYGNDGATAELGNDCVLRVNSDNGRLLWDSKHENPAPDGDTLGTDKRIYTAQDIVSNNGNCRAEVRGDHQLIITNATGGAVFTSNTANSGANFLRMQPDGNLVLYKPGGVAVWDTDTQGTGATATIGNDCVLRVNDGNGDLLWDQQNGKPAPPAPKRFTLGTGERLNLGQSLWSANERCELALQPDGNLVIYRNGRSPENVAWTEYLHGQGGQFLIMQPDGNLILYKADGHTKVWDTETDWHNLSATVSDNCVLQIRTAVQNGDGLGTLWWDSDNGHSQAAQNNGAAPTQPATPTAAPPPSQPSTPASPPAGPERCTVARSFDDYQFEGVTTIAVDVTAEWLSGCSTFSHRLEEGEEVRVLGESSTHYKISISGLGTYQTGQTAWISKSVRNSGYSDVRTIGSIEYQFPDGAGSSYTAEIQDLESLSSAPLGRAIDSGPMRVTVLNVIAQSNGRQRVEAEVVNERAYGQRVVVGQFVSSNRVRLGETFSVIGPSLSSQSIELANLAIQKNKDQTGQHFFFLPPKSTVRIAFDVPDGSGAVVYGWGYTDDNKPGTDFYLDAASLALGRLLPDLPKTGSKPLTAAEKLRLANHFVDCAQSDNRWEAILSCLNTGPLGEVVSAFQFAAALGEQLAVTGSLVVDADLLQGERYVDNKFLIRLVER